LGWWNWPEFSPRQFYDADYFQSAAARGYQDYASLEPGVRRTARARLKRITALLARHPAPRSKTIRLLEIGCGTGCFLDEARPLGWEVRGIEVSEYAARRARQRGLTVDSVAIEECAIAGPFDVVALWDVIEHLRAPGTVLQSAASALAPGGVLALSTGDLTSLCARLSGPRWHLFNLPEHLFFFSPRALKRLLARHGLHVAALTREVNWSPASYLLERVAKPLGLRPPRLLAASNWVVPATLLDVVGVFAVRDAKPGPGPIETGPALH
jgi:SAM-dependent methyltransferase